jgi:hypothetical protein
MQYISSCLCEALVQEEVVLKRCWLARYWALAARLDIHPETANGKKEFWSSLAPLPLEVVLSAGQRAKEQPSSKSQNGFSGNGKFICR